MVHFFYENENIYSYRKKISNKSEKFLSVGVLNIGIESSFDIDIRRYFSTLNYLFMFEY